MKNKTKATKGVRKAAQVKGKTKTGNYERYGTLEAKLKKIISLPLSSVLAVLAKQYGLYAKELVATNEAKAASLYAKSAKLLREAASKLSKGRELTEKEQARLFWLSAATEEELFADAVLPGAYAAAKADKKAKAALPLLKKVEKFLFTPY